MRTAWLSESADSLEVKFQSEDPLAHLGEAIRMALAYAVAGLDDTKIADQMGLNPQTVGVMLSEAAQVYGAFTRTQLLEAARLASGSTEDHSRA